jgi:hypothetical protein
MREINIELALLIEIIIREIKRENIIKRTIINLI